MEGNTEVFTSEHGSHMLLVKNTFLDIDVVPDQELAQRAFTAPPLGRIDGNNDLDDASDASSNGNNPVDIGQDVGEADKCSTDVFGASQGDELDEDEVPEMPEIGRLRTATISYESHKDWRWAQDNINQSAMLPPVQPSEPFVMYPVMCPQVVSMVPVMMAPIVGVQSEGLAIPSEKAPPPWGISRDDTGAGATYSGYGGEASLQPRLDSSACPETSALSVPIPQTLTATPSVSSNCFRVRWNVDARKLTGNDKRAVSPPFELFLGPKFPSVPCRILLQPKVVNEGKGGACFRKSKGKGFVQLKCEQKLAESVHEVAIRISIGDGSKKQPPRGAIRHSFFSSAVCGLPKDQEEWSFTSAVDKDTGTFAVCLEIVA